MINESSEEKPFKPVPSFVTRRDKEAAKRVRQRSAKYETAAAEDDGGETLPASPQ